jgi:AraC family transcriptional regulator
MNEKILHIKNMVCPRCIRVVREDLQAAGLEVVDVQLGRAVINAQGSESLNQEEIKRLLQKAGFELMEDEERIMVEAVKVAVSKLILSDNALNLTNSAYIEQVTGHSYPHLSRLFSAKEGLSIEQYIIREKIGRVKELIKYEQLTLKEIAFRLGYSSVAYLSNQFKQVTGERIREFKDSL